MKLNFKGGLVRKELGGDGDVLTCLGHDELLDDEQKDVSVISDFTVDSAGTELFIFTSDCKCKSIISVVQ